jgi:hypothetical protein
MKPSSGNFLLTDLEKIAQNFGPSFFNIAHDHDMIVYFFFLWPIDMMDSIN